MITKAELDHIHQAVPKDYYQRGIENNLFQRIWHRNRFKLITHELRRLRLDGAILDIGCHSGDLTSVVAAATQRPTCGVDLSSAAITYAQARFPRLEFRQVDFTQGLPFPDRSFQAITAFDVLEHVPDVSGTLAELKRVLVPGGYLIIGVPNENWLFKIVWFVWTKRRGHVWDGVHVQDFKRSNAYDAFQRLGFKNSREQKIILRMWRFIIFKLSA